MKPPIACAGSHSRPTFSAGTASNIRSQAVGETAMFMSPICQLPSQSQCSKAIRRPLSAARLASGAKTSAKRGSDASIPRLTASASCAAGTSIRSHTVICRLSKPCGTICLT
jgi:hypothetical protein